MGKQLRFDLGADPAPSEPGTLVPMPNKPYTPPRLPARPHVPARSMAELVADSTGVPLEIAQRAEALLKKWRAAHADAEEREGTAPWMIRSWEYVADAIGIDFAVKYARYESRIRDSSSFLTTHVDGWVDALAVH